MANSISGGDLKVSRILLIKIALFCTLCIEVTNGMKDIYIPIYGNMVGFVILFLLFFRNIASCLVLVLLNILIFIFYFFINPTYYTVSLESYKALFYIVLAVLFSTELKKYDYNEILYDVFRKYILFILFLFFIGIGIDQAGFALRIQGLMSEPSALSFILCFVLLKSFQKKNNVYIWVTFVVSILTLSLSVYIHLLLIYIFKLVKNFSIKTISKLSFLFVCCVLLFYNIPKIKVDNWLLLKIQDAITFTISGGAEGKNTRAIDFDRLLIEQFNNPLSFFLGNGPGYSVYYYQVRDMLTNTHNIFSIIFFDFGLFGLILSVIIFLFTFFKLRNSIYYDLFICILTFSLINTASGIVNEIYLFTLIFYVINLLNSKLFLAKNN